MKIFVHTKQLGKKLRKVAPCPYALPCIPGTLRELIGLLVRGSVETYNLRLGQKEPSAVLSPENIEDMSQVGKIAFGIPFGGKEVRVEEALETAFQGFGDGLYRLFLNETELTQLDEHLELKENDLITIIRLVMLTGSFF